MNKKTLLVCLTTTGDRLFAAVVTLLSFKLTNQDIDYDINLYIKYNKDFNEDLIKKDYANVLKLFQNINYYYKEDDINKLFTGININRIRNTEYGNNRWGGGG